MRRELGLVLGLVLAAGTLGFAADNENEAPAQDTRRHIKVLDNPRDISSFYTSGQSSSSPFDVGYGYDEYDENASPATDPYSISSFYQQSSPTGRYPIAGFYRQDAPAGRYPISGFYTQEGSSNGRYSRYWSLQPRSVVPRIATVRNVRMRRVAARELCFMTPTMLVPFVPFVNDGR